MRQIIDQWELLCKECFAAWFIMNNFPKGLDVFRDCSLADKKAEVDVPEYIQNRIMNNRTAKTDELRYTPPVPWVQYNDWPVCCDDFMQYMGEWQQKDFIAHSLDGNGVKLLEQLLEQDTRKQVDDI
ncbi:MAG: CbrC family protein [bacterium]|nr:CbrC family protein [bacterium]MCM1374497.1 CbrC family protein [Muribaculum sp.]